MAFLIYTGLRLLLLVAVIGLFYSLGMRGILLLVAGFVVSGVLSYIVLSGPREKFAQGVGGLFGRINRRIEESAKAEDDDTDAEADTGNEKSAKSSADADTTQASAKSAKGSDEEGSDSAEEIDLRSPSETRSQA